MANRRMVVCPPRQAQWAGVWPFSSRVDKTPTPSCSTIVCTGISILDKKYKIIIHQFNTTYCINCKSILTCSLTLSKQWMNLVWLYYEEITILKRSFLNELIFDRLPQICSYFFPVDQLYRQTVSKFIHFRNFIYNKYGTHPMMANIFGEVITRLLYCIYIYYTTSLQWNPWRTPSVRSNSA